MATKEDLLKIGREGFEVIDRAFGRNRATQRYPHHGTEEAPRETIPYPYSVYQRAEISGVPNSPYYPLPGLLQFPTKQYKVPRLVGEENPVSYPLQELYGYLVAGRRPAAEEEAVDSYNAGQLYGRATGSNYGRF